MLKKLTILICGLLLTLPCYAQPTGPTMDIEWIKAPWSDDDRPFVIVSNQIDRLAKKGQLNDGKLAEWKDANVRDRWNSTKAYRWAYGAFKLDSMRSGNGERLSGTVDALAFARRQPKRDREVRTYSYSRMRFILMAREYPVRGLSHMGQRLLKRKPNDYFAQFYTAKLLEYDHPTHGPQKQRLIAQMLRTYPNDPAIWALRTSTQYQKWLSGKKKRSEADKIRAAYKDLARRFPSLRELRDKQFEHIDRIQGRAEEMKPQLARQ